MQCQLVCNVCGGISVNMKSNLLLISRGVATSLTSRCDLSEPSRCIIAMPLLSRGYDHGTTEDNHQPLSVLDICLCWPQAPCLQHRSIVFCTEVILCRTSLCCYKLSEQITNVGGPQPLCHHLRGYTLQYPENIFLSTPIGDGGHQY